MPISADPFGELRTAEVRGIPMAYLDDGAGDAIVFQHGNPTSSYLWRNVMPHCRGLGRRLVACDLLGMGGSGKLPVSGPDRYTYAEQRDHLFALWDQLRLGDRVVLVLHDWGSALGFDWASRHPERVAGICYMEALVSPFTQAEWSVPERAPLRAICSPEGEALVLERNVFVERYLPGGVLRTLSDAEMDAYRAPFATPGEGRRPTLTWPRQIPVEGQPEDVAAVVAEYGRVDGGERHPQAVHQCRPRPRADRPCPRPVPDMAQPDGGDRPGQALRPGGQPGRDRWRDRRLRAASG